MKRVQELLVKEPDTILMTLVNPEFGLEEYMETKTMGNSLIRIFFKLLAKLFECNSLNEQKFKVIEVLIGSNYLDQLVCNNLDIQNDSGYDIELIKNVIQVCHNILTLNQSRLDSLKTILEKTEFTIYCRIKTKDLI